ncbi:MAG: hypothetical protein AAF645_29900, partial [Myxococcota bacterium]
MNGLLRSSFSVLAGALLAAAASAADAPQITLGNGADNQIEIGGLTRSGRDFTIPSVTVAQASWVVLHPFADGKPVGEIYAGATYVPAGTHEDVVVRAQTVPMPEDGTPFLVMLHSDVNEDETFDFVFVDERDVADRAVFEGTTMIAHIS